MSGTELVVEMVPVGTAPPPGRADKPRGSLAEIARWRKECPTCWGAGFPRSFVWPCPTGERFGTDRPDTPDTDVLLTYGARPDWIPQRLPVPCANDPCSCATPMHATVPGQAWWSDMLMVACDGGTGWLTVWGWRAGNSLNLRTILTTPMGELWACGEWSVFHPKPGLPLFEPGEHGKDDVTDAFAGAPPEDPGSAD